MIYLHSTSNNLNSLIFAQRLNNIAQISTYDFYRKMKTDYQSAWKDYISLCKAGGSKRYLDLLKTAHLANPFQNGEIEDILNPVILELRA